MTEAHSRSQDPGAGSHRLAAHGEGMEENDENNRRRRNGGKGF